MFHLNKIVWFFLNPVMAPLAAALFGLVLIRWGRGRARRFGQAALLVGLAVAWFAATPACVALLGIPLERPYLATQRAETLPTADAIVVLGGGMGKCPDMDYPDMSDAADRVWHAARLWKAGKAPVVVASGSNDRAAAVPLLLDLGVPETAILVDDRSRNTYENSRFTEELLKARGAGRRILLVTSAWHMPRACGNFSKTSLEVVPAAADFKAHNLLSGSNVWGWLLPSAGSCDVVNVLAKEWLGKLARK